MQNFESDIISTKPVVVETYSNCSIPYKPIEHIQQGVKEIKVKRASALKMDIDSQYRLFKFLMRVV